MKNIVLLAGLLAFAHSCAFHNHDNDGEMKKERLTYFSFRHQNTMVMFAGENYSVSTLVDGRIKVVIDEAFPDEMEFYLDDSTIFDELLAIVKTYKMDKYKSEYKSKWKVFDGDSWSLYYKYDSGRSVSSGGYMAWPDNYGAAGAAISKYFEKWRNYANGINAINYFKFTSKNNKGKDIEYTLERGEEEATVTLFDAEQGVKVSRKVSNDVLDELRQMANVIRLKDKMYDNHNQDEEATKCTYMAVYSTGDTVSGITCYTSFMGNKEGAITNFFSQWMPGNSDGE